MDMSKIDLNAPAFGPGSVPANGEPIEAKPAESVEEAVKVEPNEEVVEPKDNSVEEPEENKVPYSRFKKFHDLATQNAEELQRVREQLEGLVRAKEVETPSEVPDFWVKMYGDSEASKEAWSIQQQMNNQVKQEALETALQAVREERESESKHIEQNVAELDNQFEALSEFVGRDLTEKEQSAVLDIVDDFTPKDEDGNYQGAVMSFDKAWQIYEMKNNSAKVAKAEKRDGVAALTGSQTSGEPSAVAERNKNWNPLDWNSYKSRIEG